MKRLGRWAFNILAGASVLLSIAMVVLWIRSYRAADCIGYGWPRDESGSRSIGIVSTCGAVSFSRAHIFHSYEAGFYWNTPSPALPLTYSPGWRTFGTESYANRDERVIGFMAPHWLLTLSAALLPGLWLFVTLRRRRHRGPEYGHAPGEDRTPRVKRLGRWAFNTVAAASLALCVLTAVLWVWSRWEMVLLEHRGKGSGFSLATPKGHLGFAWSQSVPPDSSTWHYERRAPVDMRKRYPLPDWRIGPVERWDAPGHFIITVRCWALVLLFGVTPTAWWLLRGPLLRRRRAKLGLCRQCGYDLRASPERCPECGRDNAPSALAGGAE